MKSIISTFLLALSAAFTSFLFEVRADTAKADVPKASLLTVAEQSEYRATSYHRDVVDFCERLAKMSPRVRLREMGTSGEGRKLPLLILADPPVSTPEEAQRSGKLIVLAQGDIHAGEVDGKEGLMMLARDLVMARDQSIFKDLVVLIAPIFNPDGNDRMKKTNRPGQIGPIEGTGIRHNAQDLDLNRDFVKLETPEVRALVRCLNEWDPAVFIDTHTTNGCFHRYLITYDGPRHPAVDDQLIASVRDRYLPEAGRCLEEKSGYRSFYYGDFTPDHSRWETYPTLPRYGIQYAGFRNRIGILSESYSYASYKDRILATRDFVRCCFDYAAAHKAELHGLLQAIDKRTIDAGLHPGPADRVALRQRPLALGSPRTLLGYVEKKEGSKTIATKEPRDYQTVYIGTSEATHFARRPFAYLVPANLPKVVAVLQEHGIEVDELREDIELDVDIASVKKITRVARPFQRHSLVTLETLSHTAKERIPAGTLVVRTGQKLGTLAAYLLEPDSEDGLVTWNFFDQVIVEGKDFPVLRLSNPAFLLTSRAGRSAAAPKKTVTFDLVYGSRQENFMGSPISGLTWLEDGEHFLEVKENRLLIVEAATGRCRPFHDADKLAKALASLPGLDVKAAAEMAKATSFSMNPARTGAVFERGGNLYFAQFDGAKATRLAKTAAPRELLSFSPDGKRLAFVLNNNLYTVDVESGAEHQLTSDGAARISNGKADWVYFEEVFKRNHQAYWWSPDSKSIAFLHFDDYPVRDFTVINDIPALQTVERTPYPRAGDPNPLVKLGAVSATGGDIRWVDLPDYPPKDTLIVAVGWTPDSGEIYFYGQNRIQTWLDLCTVPRSSGKAHRLLRETTRAWVDNPGEPSFQKDGSFILASERTGWRHYYLFDKSGNLRNPITAGEWEARTLERFDESSGYLYFSGTRDSPIASNLYRIKLDGSGLQRLTAGPGEHRVQVSPKCSCFIDSHSTFQAPQQVSLFRTDGAKFRALDSNPVPALPDYRFGAHELVQIRTPDGFVLEGSLVKPPDFDPARRYPVWFLTYAGLHTPTIRDAWGPSFAYDQVAASLGFVVFRCDPRSASGKGAVSAWTAYKRLGVHELADIETAIRWLTAQPFVDGSRIGMSGHSYGGFMTSFALTHSSMFAAGIAGAPVTDWRDYDTIYTERYMDTPQANPKGYDETSVVKAASKLHGRLLIIHGLMDDNVHLQNTAQLVQALQQADKDFEIMVYPRARHPIFGRHYRRLLFDFMTRALHVSSSGHELPTVMSATSQN
jgi:dipeptidyl aminopeptidase/acylaminoacyl peptidase